MLLTFIKSAAMNIFPWRKNSYYAKPQRAYLKQPTRLTSTMKRTALLSKCSTLALSALLSSNVFAQDIEEIYSEYFENWYQVEIIIFERIQENQIDVETWSKNIQIEYPDKLQFLYDEATLAELEKMAEAQASEENSVLLQKLKDSEGNTTPRDPLIDKSINAVEQSENDRLKPKEKPFIKLKPEERNLSRDARVLSRDRSMRVLFHEAWRQPFSAFEDSIAIPVAGGDLFDENHELEGSLTLYVARYLHIHTNLWLTQFEANFGQEIDHWPRLPLAPKPTLIQNTEANIEDTLLTDNPANNNTNTQQAGETLETAPQLGSWEIGVSGQRSNNSLDFTPGQPQGLFGDYTNLAQKPFVVKQIVTMAQKRRMRSGELHYIDHPRLGLIIKIDRYEPKAPSVVEPNQ